MKREEFYFDSRDNRSKIHAIRWTPESGNVVGIVQVVHGMSEYAGRYEELAAFLTGRGFVVTGEDHLGHGKSAGEDGLKGYFCEQDPATVVVRDVHRLKKMTQELYPGVPYFILGHSMGSFILRNYICRYGTGISGALILGTGMQPGALLAFAGALTAAVGFFKGQKHPSRFINYCAFGSYNKKISNPTTPFDWLSKDEEKVQAYIADEDCGFVFTVNGFKTLFTLISRIRKKKNLKNVPDNLPIFMASGEDDPVGDYGRGVKKAYDSLKAVGVEDITLKIYSEDRHELMNELDRETIMEDIAEWLTKYLAN
ncbi:MAG: lysophospholipase [Lachnospiraceae bacterium]|nr:lysophospholipase [Lachnospiraceae bacterium]